MGLLRKAKPTPRLCFRLATSIPLKVPPCPVKAMLALAAGNAVQEGERPLILAARNVHKPFFTAVPSWIWTWNGCIRAGTELVQLSGVSRRAEQASFRPAKSRLRCMSPRLTIWETFWISGAR